ncbi:MAG TPA: fumarylacetoacetate hydrolase family protein [Candidatus Sulfomarinibacteraceae bacterium]|nr:fumarylacetoacetate hydrolase family protein [Candidatus Sulfomarinibacteraceae bacterium]
MRLLTFEKEGRLALGVSVESGVVDVGNARQKLGGTVQEVPDEMHALIAGGNAALKRLKALVERAAEDEGLLLREEEIRFGPCVTAPEKILCIGLNYERHARETGAKLPEEPVLFSKFNSALAAHGEPVPIPPGTGQMDYEAELAVVIGRQARHVGEDEALDYVFGYCNANDVSARDLQMLSGQWLLGKTPDKFLPLGPYLVTADEVPDPQALAIAAYVNGEQRQSSTTGDMIFTVAQVISYASRYMTLQPGDVISTGTPEGVALAMDPQPWLQPGDEVVIEVQSLGRLHNNIVAS